MVEISLFAHRCLRYPLADASIMNSQIIRNLFQSISMTPGSSMDVYISLGPRPLSAEYLIETRPAYIPLRGGRRRSRARCTAGQLRLRWKGIFPGMQLLLKGLISLT
jgi:hypothetical protein